MSETVQKQSANEISGTEKQVDSEKEIVNSQKKEPAEPKFTIPELRRKCVALFGVSSSTFAGAMNKHHGEELTVKEAKAILERWLRGGKK